METTWKPLTEIHLLVTAGTHVGLPGESGDAASWGQITVTGRNGKGLHCKTLPVRREITVLLEERVDGSDAGSVQYPLLTTGGRK